MEKLDKLKEKAKSYFCDRTWNFPTGKPFNCCETISKILSEHFDLESNLIPKIGTGIGVDVSRNGL